MALPEWVNVYNAGGWLGLLIFLAPRAWNFFKGWFTGNLANRTSLQLADKQMEAGEVQRLGKQVDQAINLFLEANKKMGEMAGSLGTITFQRDEAIKQLEMLRKEAELQRKIIGDLRKQLKIDDGAD